MRTIPLALTWSYRADKVCCLDIRYLIKRSSGYAFHFSKITKTGKKSKIMPPIKYVNFKSCKTLCVCYHNDQYIKNTKNI